MIDQRLVELRLSIRGQASLDKVRIETVTRVREECVGLWVCVYARSCEYACGRVYVRVSVCLRVYMGMRV